MHHKPHIDALGTNLSFHGENLVTNCLSCGMAKIVFAQITYFS
jgi:hypothetical protein